MVENGGERSARPADRGGNCRTGSARRGTPPPFLPPPNIRRAAASTCCRYRVAITPQRGPEIFPQCSRSAPGEDAPDPGPSAGLPDRAAGKQRFDSTCERFGSVLRIRTISHTSVLPSGCIAPLRPTKLGHAQQQSILAPQQLVSAPAQRDSFLRMQRMAHLMHLRALAIVIRPVTRSVFPQQQSHKQCRWTPAVLRAPRWRAG